MISDSSLILVISDSHGNVPALTAALGWARQIPLPGQKYVANQEHAAGQNRAPQELAAAVFLGDGWEDLDAASAQTGFAVPWYKVRGNGDLNLSIPHSLVLDVSVPKGNSPGTSRKLFLAHGNRYGVGEGGQTIAAAARAAGAEAALFGHTHNPHCSVLDGLFLLNPGSIGRSRSNAGPTFAVLECPAAGPLGARFFRLVKQDRKFAVEELEL